MNFADYHSLLLERRNKVLYATMNRPETMNAVDDRMDFELQRLFIDIIDDAETNVLVLTGAGKAFSAGGDMNEIKALIEEPDRFNQGTYKAKRLIYQLLDCPKPVIAKVNGHAVGLGATLALFCDVIFAAEHAKIGDPHVKVGFVAGDGGAVIWPQLVGYARAKEYLLTGDLLLAPEAEKIGLINHSVPAAQLDARVDEFAQRLAAGAQRAIQWTKISINIGLKQLAHSVLEASMAYEALSNHTADHREAVDAILEKRDPKFTGQ